jgi:hypothetical protein
MGRFQAVRSLAWAGIALLFAAQAASAQQPQVVRVRGTIEKVDGQVLTVKARDGAMLTIKVPDNVRVLGMVKISIADIKPGAYVGVSALPNPGGGLKALHVHQFLEAMRGVAEGHRGWDLGPQMTMTNATVAEVMAVTGGQTLLLKYKDGEQKILVGPDTPVVNYVPGDKSELKPGAQIFIIAAQKQPDGTLSAAAVSVGRGITPPM